MLLNLLELASNAALEHDPKTVVRLAKLQGKTMTLKIKSLNQVMPPNKVTPLNGMESLVPPLSITPQREGLEFSHDTPDNVDVTLSATLGAMIKISRNGMENAELDAGELEIAGDPIVGQRFAQLISELNIDWEALLAEHIGDSPAKAVNFAAGQAKVFADESRSKFKDFLNNLITEELSLVADKADVDTHLDDVDTIRADVDRLNARLERLKAKI